MEFGLRDALRTGEYSDLVIRCGSFQANVHKVVVCTQSKIFAAACKPESFKEGQDGVITIKANGDDPDAEDDVDASHPNAVKLMIDYLYNNSNYFAPIITITKEEANLGMEKTYQPAPAGKSIFAAPVVEVQLIPEGDCNLVMHARLYALGSAYDIPGLKTLAAQKFATAGKYAWSHATFLEAIDIVYKTTPDTDKALRNVVVATALDHISILGEREEFDKTVRSIDGLAYDLLKGKSKPPGRTSACGFCGTSKSAICPSCHQHYRGCACTSRCKTCDVAKKFTAFGVGSGQSSTGGFGANNATGFGFGSGQLATSGFGANNATSPWFGTFVAPANSQAPRPGGLFGSNAATAPPFGRSSNRGSGSLFGQSRNADS